MMSLFPVLVFLVHTFLHISEASQCSELHLTPLNTDNDENYSILIEKLQSSNVMKISLINKQTVSDTSWFVMGASDSSKLIGSWEPFTPIDGQVIDCLTSSEQAVTNQNSINENPTKSQFTFYWMAPPSLKTNTITFVATIFYNNPTNDKSTVGYIQSIPVQLQQTQGRDRYQDVSPSKLIYFNYFFIN